MARIEPQDTATSGGADRQIAKTATRPSTRQLIEAYAALTPEAHDERAALANQMVVKDEGGVATSESALGLAAIAAPQLGRGYTAEAIGNLTDGNLVAVAARFAEGIELPQVNPAQQALAEALAAMADSGDGRGQAESMLGPLPADDMEGVQEALIAELRQRVFDQIADGTNTMTGALAELPEEVHERLLRDRELALLLGEQAELPTLRRRAAVAPGTKNGEDPDLERQANEWLGLYGPASPDDN